MPVDQVHLHEVGALDSIIDIVGAVYALETLAADRVVVSPINVGSGMVQSAHGVFPVPAPATVRCSERRPIFSRGPEAELLTPTGALLLTSYAQAFGPIPPMRVTATGYGAGDHEFADTPNVLRVLLGEADAATAPGRRGDDDRVLVIESEIDDMNPQLFGPLMDRLLRGRRARRVLRAGADEEEPARHAGDGPASRRRARTRSSTCCSARRRPSACGSPSGSASAWRARS